MFMCGQKVLQKVLKLLISSSGLALRRGEAQTEAECSLCRLLLIAKCGRKGPLGRERERRAGGAWPVRVREILAKAPAAGTTEADGNKSTIIWCVMIHRGTSVGVKTAVHHGGNTVSSVPLVLPSS